MNNTHRANAMPRPTRRTWITAVAGAALLAACGGGGGGAPEGSTDKASAASQPRMRATAVTLNPAGWVTVPQRADALMQGLTIPPDAPTRGMWSRAGTWPINGLHQAVLPDGRVLTWGGDAFVPGSPTPTGEQQNGRYFVVWDPYRGLFDAGAFTTSYDPNAQDSFCAPAVYLTDGRLMITGGNGNLTNSTYTPSTGARAFTGPVGDQRWYATMLTLADGRPIVVGGINPYTEGQFNNVAGALQAGESSMRPEVFENGAWRTLLGAESRAAWGPDFLRASMPKAWLAPDGRVFGISTDQVWYVDPNANGGTGATTIVGGWKGPPQAGATNDTAPNVGPTSTGVMFAPGRVLIVGGNSYANGSGFLGSRQATVVDINGGGAVRTEQPLMAFARNLGNVTVLPDGRVLASGGETRANNDPFWGVYAAELWNPATGTWTTMASSTVFRGYHSQASLLLNGTVLKSGGGVPGPVQLRGDVFYPPYLFRAAAGGGAELAPRPRMLGVSGLNQVHGGQMQIDMASTDSISQVVLVGLSVGTHAFNSGQRRIPLTYTQEQFRLTATLPGNTLAPPGYYQVVAINAAGVPSVGTVIAVGQGVAAPAVPTTPYTPPEVGGGGGGAAVPPVGAVACATEGQTCTPPAGSTATVWYGADTRWASRTGVTGSIACTNATFGDPVPGAAKSCVYVVTTQPPPPPPPTGGGTPVGAWNFDAVSGAVAPDASGSNRPITLTNTTLVAGRNGGQAVQFNGVDASGSTAGAVLDTAGSFTVATWVRMDALTGWRTMVNQDGAVVSGFWLQYSEFVGNKFLLSMHDADSNTSAPFRAVGTTTPVVGRWYHVVGVRDRAAGTMRLYVDGRLEGSTPYAGGWAANGSFNIGRGRFNGPNDWLAGALDDVQAFNTALTDAQVAALYAGSGAGTGPVIIPPIAIQPINAGGTATYTVAAQAGATYSWDFGDGSPATPFSPTATASKLFASPGVFGVTLTARSSAGVLSTRSFLQAVGTPATATRPTASSAIALETRAGASARLWVANPDNDTVAVIDTATNARVAEIAVGTSPRSVAIAPDGRVWVTNKAASTISILSPASLTVAATVALPRAAQPHGLVFAPGGSAFVVLEASGQLQKLDPVTGAVQGTLAVGANPRHVSAAAGGALVLVSRFITNPLPGEATAAVDTTTAGAEVVAVNAGPMTLNRTIVLRHSDRVDNEVQGAGIPNYLAAAVISPDGARAWVPSKQDNVKRGTLRNGQALNFQNSVRAISSRIDMASLAEDLASRVDHDNSSLGSGAAYHPSGAYLFVALETSRQVAVVDAFRGRELAKFDVGRAPQALAVSSDGTRLYAQNFMDRTVSVIDLGPLVTQGLLQFPALASPATVATERLPAQVLLGKQLFYDARDPRLARDSYMSCASCHSDAGHDGRTWDFSSFGEGLRNTPALAGRAGTGQGFQHWSANFDETQDFEGQIRAFAGGTGLMTDAQFNTGTRNTPLGDRKAGLSADLDALAAYLASLNAFERSPGRNADGTLSAAALAGRTVFANANCASCHGGSGFSISGDGSTLRNIGTLKPGSGQRLGAALTGIDVPTLRDVWKTAPYLHDGSAPTLAAAVQAHAGNTVAGTDLTNLVAYLQQIGSEEAGPAAPPPPNQPPATAVTCASEGGICTIPAGSTATVWYGAGTRWAVRSGVTGSIGCNNTVFGDPIPGTVKSCRYQTGASVPANQPPTVSVAAPASVVQGTAASLTATAADADGTVARVEFYAGGTLLGTDTAAPYALSWTPTAAGSFAVTARAFDNTGAATTSAPVTVAVTASPPPPNQPPTVSVAAPAGVTLGTAVSLTATAVDADGTVARVEFYAGTTLLGTDTTAPYALGWTPTVAGSYAITARAFDNTGASTTSTAVTVTVTAPVGGTGSGLTATYFANPDLAGTPVLTRTEVPWFDWGTGAPAAGVPADNFSVRWRGEVQAVEGGAYQFRTLSDDGVRVWVNGVLVINNWTVHAPTVDTSGTVTLAAGQRVSIVVEFNEFGGGAVLQLSWLRPGGAWAAVPAAQLYPAAASVSNLAPGATLATSYVSPWETLAAVNNNITPASSADKNGGAYGNWQGEALYGRTDWVSFSWSSARTLSAFEVYWWNDGLGIATPTSARVEYWNGSAWVLLGSPGLALNTFNRLTFAPVTTTSIRVSMASARATGILEARVFGF